MVGFENHIGKITVSESYITEIVRHTVMDCFGVSGLSGVNTFHRAMSGLTFGKAFKSKSGVSVRIGKNGGLVIDLHIKVSHGTNITAALPEFNSLIRACLNDSPLCAVTLFAVKL